MAETRDNFDEDVARAAEMLQRLERDYGRPDWHISRPPLDELVLTILSQHTSDANCERAFNSLRAAFPAWTDVADADEDDIAEAIRSGGLATVKAPRIKAVVTGALASDLLDDLPRLPLSEAKARLQSLAGVGPKTAACVLLFACHRPALPVDTHVYRVSQRVGLISDGTSAERAHELLERLLSPDDVYSFHVNVIRHGRQACRARNPRCDACPLATMCRYALDGVNSHGQNGEVQWRRLRSFLSGTARPGATLNSCCMVEPMNRSTNEDYGRHNVLPSK